MSDIYATMNEATLDVQERIADVLELRAAEPQQQAMLQAYLSKIEFPKGAQVLEVGCGTGAVTRVLASWPGVAEAVGIDHAPVFLVKARELSGHLRNLSFKAADGRSLPCDDQSYDVVVFHTTLCHVPGPEAALAEGYRVLRRGGWLAIFDGDYATITVATGDLDPLQMCADAFSTAYVHNRWLIRQLPALVRAAGFQVTCLGSHGYAETLKPSYMLTIIDRGADALAGVGRIGIETASALKAEARRRAENGEFFGHIAYASLIARKAW